MAKPIDEKKMLRVRETAIKLVTELGYTATSVEKVAKAAGVSNGYLYRYYPSKASLIQNLYEEKMTEFHNFIFESLSTHKTFSNVLDDIIEALNKMSIKEQNTFRFLFLMLHDHNFIFPEICLKNIRKICSLLHKKGLKNNEISIDYTPENVFYSTFSIPFKFFDSRMRSIFIKRKINTNDLKLLKRICKNALQ